MRFLRKLRPTRVGIPTLVGMRVLKTALAVAVCLVLRMLSGEGGFEYSAIAAVLAMQQTPRQTFTAGVDRLAGTILGAAGGFLVLSLAEYIPWYVQGSHIIVISLGLVLVSWLCLATNRATGVALSCVTFLSLVTNFGRTISDTGLYVLIRLVDTSLGVVVAVIIDFFIFPNSRPATADAPEALEDPEAAAAADSLGEGQ